MKTIDELVAIADEKFNGKFSGEYYVEIADIVFSDRGVKEVSWGDEPSLPELKTIHPKKEAIDKYLKEFSTYNKRVQDFKKARRDSDKLYTLIDHILLRVLSNKTGLKVNKLKEKANAVFKLGYCSGNVDIYDHIYAVLKG